MLINWPVLGGELVKILLVILIFAVIWLSRRLLGAILARPLTKLLQRNGRTDVADLINKTVVLPARILVIALGIFIAGQVLQLGQEADAFVGQITGTLVIIAITLIVYRLITLIFFTRGRLYSITGIAVEEALLPFARTGLQLIIIAIALVFIINRLGYDVSGLIAGLGIGGLAISLAAQDTLSNLFGFTAIVGDRPFVVGEYIKTKEVEGIIERVGLRSTRVRQLDQAVVTVPNSVLAASPILNWSRLQKRQINAQIGITYGANADQLEALLERLRVVLAARETVDETTVIVNFINFGESSLEILIRCYVGISDWAGFTQEKELIFLDVMRTVDEMGLQVAFPSRTLYIENMPELRKRQISEGEHSAEADGQESEANDR